ncbi:hypothetical protein ACFWU5_21665 [Nocardia sp. NPDC058640]|uniref:hypothetical protein n=1 Tax=Nocardia sp. NPDC058640 TaxID=3346571 RepID=UPI0036481ED7
MSEFRVTGVFPVSYKPNPFVTGYAIGDFRQGDHVELRRGDEVIAHGTLQWIEFHRSSRGEYSFTFSDTISQLVQPGDVMHSTSTAD